MIAELNRIKNGCGFVHAVSNTVKAGKCTRPTEHIMSGILTVIRKHKNIPLNKLQERSGYSAPTVRKYLDLLIADNKITATYVGNSGRFPSFVYNKVSDNG